MLVLSMALALGGCGGEKKPDAPVNTVPVRIGPEAFPDEAFREYIRSSFDTNEDNVLDEEEIKRIKTLELSAKGIGSLKGIEWLTELTYLNCGNPPNEVIRYSENEVPNVLKELDVSKNRKLAALYCYENELTTLDVSHNPELTILSCYGNALKSLDVSKNEKLTMLACNSNELTQLDMKGNKELSVVHVDEKVEVSVNESRLDITRHPDNEKELKAIGEDDWLIHDLDMSCQACLADEKFYTAMDSVVEVTIDNECAISVKGMGRETESFTEEIHNSVFAFSPQIKEEFKSEAFRKEGSSTKLVYCFNSSLYTIESIVVNNIEGSRYYDENYDPKHQYVPENFGITDPGKVNPVDPVETDPGHDSSKTLINVYAFTNEVPNMIKKYMNTHRDFARKYEVNFTLVSTDNHAYESALASALAYDPDTAPNLYMAEAAFIKKFTTGSASSHACTYEDLGINVEQKIKAAKIAPYIADVTRRDEKIVGLSYQGNGCAFIYNRNVAKDVFGDDRPETVEAALGKDWESFFLAAEKCKEKGYAIVSGADDIWFAVANSADHGWVVDGKLYIDPKRESFLDYSKRLMDYDYHNDTRQWSEDWFADLAEVGPKKVLGFYGPEWFINYTLNDHCESTYGDWGVCRPNVASFWGGTWLIANKNVLQNEDLKAGVRELIEYITLDTSETGLQYEWANAIFDYPDDSATKDSVASRSVMERSDGSKDILNGQDVNPVFIDASDRALGDNLTEYDEWIEIYWKDAVRMYSAGEKSREDAIAWFKSEVKLNIEQITVE